MKIKEDVKNSLNRFRLYNLCNRLIGESKFSIPEESLDKLSILQDSIFANKVVLSYGELCEIDEIENLYEACEKNPNDETLKRGLLSHIDLLYHLSERTFLIPPTKIFNSEDYYLKTISDLEEENDKLEKQLNESKQSEEQKERIRKELEESKKQIEQIKLEKGKLEKKIDAQDNIKKKIKDAFDELKGHISYLEEEKTRLNKMFNAYAILCMCVLLILVTFEIIYLIKWETPTKWTDYLPFYIPVPIVGGLLWTFIYQMNRAQRQLILVAYELYHVDYVEGLLQVINMVSPNAASASEKIVNVLDFLIKKHNSIPNDLFEKSLDKEISKDNVDLNTFVNMAKEVKDVLK